MLATILVWSGAWIAMKRIVPYIGPYDFVVVRYLCGALVLFVGALLSGRPLAMPPWRLTVLAAAAHYALEHNVARLVGACFDRAQTMPRSIRSR